MADECTTIVVDIAVVTMALAKTGWCGEIQHKC